MRFSIAAVLAFAASALAADPTPGFNAITKPTKNEDVPAGSTYDIVWLPSAEHPGAIKIGLLGGATPATLNVLDTIATGIDASEGTYSWAVPSTLGSLATYGIIITLESDKDIFQYSFPFHITSGSGSTASASGSASGTASGSVSSTTGGSKPSTTGGAKTSSSSSVANSTVVSSTSAAPSSTVVSSSSFIGNLSTTAGPSQTTITTLSTVKPTTTKATTTAVATNGVASLAAGSFAVLGGVAMAMLAM
ncbi:Ser-Thr-rich glycosyl-phosphatidyl-inositol-anchored membrane family-domain-containing protein [Staphylotrichum tortipilum]|uniref:Ser-Thr-rich glycosyl-phosphatidyl-inositol-anchored membrane family-domain-containing protein n=1 Tax=Staphylotrichum tortipilum TaxID=2831512 RepID=A0AAN6MD89_9PEZI|nr:Ser-Thr-rich glycosyl-phosphatidyl-inositol-anchored membrane family-domain-containing protein [Staphylotrichum longicolle]